MSLPVVACGQVAAAAASRTFLHVADLQRPPPPEARRVDESDQSDQSDQSCEEAAFTSARRPRSAEAWSAEAHVVPDVTAPSDARRPTAGIRRVVWKPNYTLESIDGLEFPRVFFPELGTIFISVLEKVPKGHLCDDV